MKRGKKKLMRAAAAANRASVKQVNAARVGRAPDADEAAGYGPPSFWMKIPGTDVEVKVRRLNSAILAQAERRKEAIAAALREDPNADTDWIEGAIFAAHVQSLARVAIVAWRGVTDKNGDLVPITPEAIDHLMERHPCGNNFAYEYLVLGAHALAAGNARRLLELMLGPREKRN